MNMFMVKHIQNNTKNYKFSRKIPNLHKTLWSYVKSQKISKGSKQYASYRDNTFRLLETRKNSRSRHFNGYHYNVVRHPPIFTRCLFDSTTIAAATMLSLLMSKLPVRRRQASDGYNDFCIFYEKQKLRLL